jgi:hypothetical protein
MKGNDESLDWHGACNVMKRNESGEIAAQILPADKASTVEQVRPAAT